MRYDRFFAKLYCSPLLLEAGVRASFERVLDAYMSGEPVDLQSLQAGQEHKFFGRKVDGARADKWADNLLEVDGATAFIHIDGAIDRNLSALDRLCFDATDLNDVNRAIDRIASDSSIKNVQFNFNSPGGTVNGVPETAGRITWLGDSIANGGAGKNTQAFVDGMCCSAAFWLACACHQTLQTPSSFSGSIGVYMALLDESRRLENLGVKVETIKDGKLKAAGAPWKALTDEERAHYQEITNQIGTLFRAAVTSKRPDVSIDTMQGQSFFGTAALAAGLVDGIVANRAAALAQF